MVFAGEMPLSLPNGVVGIEMVDNGSVGGRISKVLRFFRMSDELYQDVY